LTDSPLARFARQLAADLPSPAAGSAAAAAVAMAAGLAELAARRSGEAETATRAAAARSRAVVLADADADAYAEVLATAGDARRDALGRASGVLHEIAEAAAEVTALAAALAERGKPALRHDAAAAVELAEAAGRVCERLVRANE